MITWNTDANAPCCPGEIVNDDGRTILIQTDWDFPPTAQTFGWNMATVQRCPICGHVRTDVDTVRWWDCPKCDNEHHDVCSHSGTDGTVDCPECGLAASDMISAACDYLDSNDGATADDPGYFG